MKTVTLWLMAKGGARLVLDVITALLGVSRAHRIALRGCLREIERLYALNGAEFTVRYLKEATLHVLHYLAGSPDATCQSPIWVGLTGGLPKVIPGELRTQLRVGNVLVIRLVLTLLGIYRVIEFPGKIKLETIAGPFTGTLGTLPEFMAYLPALARNAGWTGALAHLPSPKLYLSTSAGPNGGPAVVTALWDAYALYHSKQEWSQFSRFVRATWGRHWVLYLVPALAWCASFAIKRTSLVPRTSRLHQKEEAAGKIRVFAIVDYWSQMVLRPIHYRICKILRAIDQDGTFDQQGCVRYMREYIQANRPSCVYSYDLSAATDRVPAILYQVLLGILRTPPAKGGPDHIRQESGLAWAQHWKELLTWRVWTGEDIPKGTMYLVGQPMGAYSSWVLLALTHHALVQLAWSKAGGEGWFRGYVVLGDDVVIADGKVASEYLAIMTDLGVEISLHKSLVSPKGYFEFAKRFSSPEGELTGLPWGVVVDAVRYIGSYPTLLNWAASAGYSISPIAAVKAYALMLGCPWAAWFKQPVGHLPPVVRNTLLAGFSLGGLWWRDFSRFVSAWTMTVEDLSETVRLNLSASVVDDWTVMDELRLTAVSSLREKLSPASWCSVYTEALSGLNIYGGEWISVPGGRKFVRNLEKFPQWVRHCSPLGLLLVRLYLEQLWRVLSVARGAVILVLKERAGGIVRPWRWALRDAWAEAWLNHLVPNFRDTDASYARAIVAASRLVVGRIRVLAPSAKARIIQRTNLSWVSKSVRNHIPRLPRGGL